MERREDNNMGGLGVGYPPNPKKKGGSKCGSCCSRITSMLCSNLGVCLLVLLYTVAGAFLFASIEGGHQNKILVGEPSMQHVTEEDAASSTEGPVVKVAPVIDSHQRLMKMRQETVERLWTITESLNILYRDNWTRVADKELEKFSEHLLNQVKNEDQTAAAASRDAKVAKPHQWSFSGAFLYSLTVITTIGYGSVAPHTALGKIVTILYALLGIPLMLLYLSSVGDFLSRILKWIWGKLCRCGGRRRRKKLPPDTVTSASHIPGHFNMDSKKFGKWQDTVEDNMDAEGGAVPVTMCLVVMVAYMCGGAAIFSYTHNWSFLNSLYFCFSALTTIGFGDLSPGVGTTSETSLQLSLLGASIYLLIGMALIATCFNLMQEQLTSRNSILSRKLGGIGGGLPHNGHHHHRFHLDDT